MHRAVALVPTAGAGTAAVGCPPAVENDDASRAAPLTGAVDGTIPPAV